MVAYLILVAMRDPVWFDANHVTPPIEQLVAQVSLAAAGLVVGQLVRMTQQVTEEVFARQSSEQETAA